MKLTSSAALAAVLSSGIVSAALAAPACSVDALNALRVPDVTVTQRVDMPIIDTPADKQLIEAKKIIESKSTD